MTLTRFIVAASAPIRMLMVIGFGVIVLPMAILFSPGVVSELFKQGWEFIWQL